MTNNTLISPYNYDVYVTKVLFNVPTTASINNAYYYFFTLFVIAIQFDSICLAVESRNAENSQRYPIELF